jgi:hypothetical protein
MNKENADMLAMHLSPIVNDNLEQVTVSVYVCVCLCSWGLLVVRIIEWGFMCGEGVCMEREGAGAEVL